MLDQGRLLCPRIQSSKRSGCSHLTDQKTEAREASQMNDPRARPPAFLLASQARVNEDRKPHSAADSASVEDACWVHVQGAVGAVLGVP